MKTAEIIKLVILVPKQDKFHTNLQKKILGQKKIYRIPTIPPLHTFFFQW